MHKRTPMRNLLIRRPMKRIQFYKDLYKNTNITLFWQMLGYAFTFVIHVSNLVFLEVMKGKESSTISNDPRVQIFRGLMFRYFTCWTVLAQIVNSVIGFVCDALLFYYMDYKTFQLPKSVHQFRETLFSSVVWPCTMVVTTVFWTLYLYDRSLIYPEFLDDIIGAASNHILHTLIVPIVFWEVIFRRREKPYSHARYIQQMVIYMVVYLFVLYYTFYTEGFWLYPIFEVTYGTLDFITLHLAIAALLFMFYYLQWVFNDLIHGKKEKKKKIKLH